MPSICASIPDHLHILWGAIWEKEVIENLGMSRSSIIARALKEYAKNNHPELYRKHIGE